MLNIKISEIQVYPVRKSRGRRGHFFVRLELNDNMRDTEVLKADSDVVSWDEAFHFDVPNRSRLKFTLRATHHIRSETIVGSGEVVLDSGFLFNDFLHNKTETLETHIRFKVEELPSGSPPAAVRQIAAGRGILDGLRLNANAAVWPGHIPNVELQAGNVSHRNLQDLNLPAMVLITINSIPEAFGFLVNHFSRFAELVGHLSEIHPCVKIAFNVLIVVHKVVADQTERDDRLHQLITTHADMFAFLNKLQMADLEGHRQTIKLLAHQTTECGYFMRDYTKHKFVHRAATNMLRGSTIDSKFTGYEKTFSELKRAFRDNATLDIQITVHRIADEIHQIGTAQALNDLRYAAGARFDRGKQCLSGTREGIIENIFDWVNDSDQSRVLVLSGAAGTGKSAIAHTISLRFDELKRLGSSFFFLPGNHERLPDTLFSTIARDLADLDPNWKDALMEVIRDNYALRKTSSILEQFEEFILRPARRLQFYLGPVVIVIDALDASGNQEDRQSLLSMLSERTKELPPNFRIFVTTRPEPDISHAFRSSKDVLCWDMEDVAGPSNLPDITAFFADELSKVVGLDSNHNDDCSTLAAKSEGNFGQAADACAYLKRPGHSVTPAQRLARLITDPWPMVFAQRAGSMPALYDESDGEGFMPWFNSTLSGIFHRSPSMTGHNFAEEDASQMDGGVNFPVPAPYQY
ncbi:hypothetical protein B0H16DRAFT_863427 [Mycena metata]|uniref:C2 domain-containing protein n=1 Tax=Mycena metata TaxID=1033252 RepID=A0AAD7IT71_9AGAR|nr:hypothetical protein B0H16DRAFT_863427 [Mycena metata]